MGDLKVISCPCECGDDCKCKPCPTPAPTRPHTAAPTPHYHHKPKCFPAEARILLDTDETIQVKDLRAGHRILTGNLIRI